MLSVSLTQKVSQFQIVVATKTPQADPEGGGQRMDAIGWEGGVQCKENTMNASSNIIVNLDGGSLLVSTYGNFESSGLSAEMYLFREPKPQTMDHNCYFSAGGTVRMLPNQTAAQELLGLDVHSLLGVDPLLELSDLNSVHVREGSPALRLGFRNFDYGPRAKQLKSDDTSHGTKPHLVFLFCDNVGWSNLGYHRTHPTREVVTPQIDGLVRTGLELDRM